MNKKLKTLGLAATLLLSGCYTTRDLQNEPSQQYGQLEERVENVQPSTTKEDVVETSFGLDWHLQFKYEIHHDKTFDTSEATTPSGIHAHYFDLGTRQRHSFAFRDLMNKEFVHMGRRYFGIPAEQRELLMFNDLYETKGKLFRYHLGEHETQRKNAQYIQELEGRVQRQSNRISRLETQRDNYRTKANTQETTIIQEPCYEPQIIRQGPISSVSHQIADEDVAVRVGDDYIVLPFAGIVCPSKESDQRACLSIQDIIEDFKKRDVEPYERP